MRSVTAVEAITKTRLTPKKSTGVFLIKCWKRPGCKISHCSCWYGVFSLCNKKSD